MTIFVAPANAVLVGNHCSELRRMRSEELKTLTVIIEANLACILQRQKDLVGF